MTLTTAEIITQDKISEQSFERKATAARDQAEYWIEQAEKLDGCARIAREHWMELEKTL